MRTATVLAVLSALGGVACATAPKVPPQAPPVLETPALAVSDQTFSSVGLALELPVHNPGPAGAEAQSVRWQLRSGDRPLGQGEASLGVALPAGETTRVAVPLAFERLWSSEALEALGASFPVVVEGTLEVAGPVGDPAPLAFARAVTVRTPRLPTVELVSAYAAQSRSDQLDLALQLQVVNDNPFALRVRYLSQALWVAGSQVEEGREVEGETIPGSSALQFGLRVTLTPSEAPGLAALLASGGTLDYRLEGTLQLGDRPVPVSIRDRVPVSATP